VAVGTHQPCAAERVTLTPEVSHGDRRARARVRARGSVVRTSRPAGIVSGGIFADWRGVFPGGCKKSPAIDVTLQSARATLRSSRAQAAVGLHGVASSVLLATAVYAGLRIQELLALRWQDVDLEAGVIRVRGQLTRGSRTRPPRLVELKTRAGARDIVPLPMLADRLRTHRRTAFSAGRATLEDYVFQTSERTPLNYRNVATTRGLDNAANKAGLNRDGVPKAELPRSAPHVRQPHCPTGTRPRSRSPSDGPLATVGHPRHLRPRVRRGAWN
jgi:hypothetical protein